MNEVIGTVAGSYTDYHCEQSYVENISNGGYYSKNQNNNTTDDLDSIIIDEYNRRILRTTTV